MGSLFWRHTEQPSQRCQVEEQHLDDQTIEHLEEDEY